MRVVAGTARSIHLDAPEGKDVRPTIDRFKETVFNILQQRIPGCRFLDIFAGSGAMGIEALSRGAAVAVFVEHSSTSMKCITANLERTKLFEKAVLLKYDYTKALALEKEKGSAYDVIFMDPPYGKGLEEAAAERIAALDLLADDGMLVIECSADTDLGFLGSMGFSVVKERRFKTTRFAFIEKTA